MNNLKPLLVCLTFIPLFAFGQNAFFRKQQVLEDLALLQSALFDKHPNINIYASKKEFADFFKNIIITDRLTELDPYSLIIPIKVQDAPKKIELFFDLDTFKNKSIA